MTSVAMTASALVRHVRNQCERARALDGRLERALVFRAGSGNTPRLDLAALGDEGRQHLDVLVRDVIDLLDAELADAPAPEESAATRALVVLVLGRALGTAATAPA